MPLRSSVVAKIVRSWSVTLLVGLMAASAWAAATGSMSGTIKDPSGSVIPGASLVLANLDLTTQYKASTDEQGLYSFPSLPVGRYELTIEAAGFKTVRKTGLVMDTDAALKVDATLEIGQQSETVTVAATAATTEAQVDTVATHLGELVTGSQMTSLPLNGRSYTDLLSIQPGVIPVTTLQPNSVIMAGVTGCNFSIRRLESRQPIHRRAARIGEWFHSERRRRPGAHERRAPPSSPTWIPSTNSAC